MKDITIDPEILGGLPVFTSTRVPVQALFDYLEGGDSLADLLPLLPEIHRVLPRARKGQAVEIWPPR